MSFTHDPSSITSAIAALFHLRTPKTASEAAGAVAAMLIVNEAGDYRVLPKLPAHEPSPYGERADADRLAYYIADEIRIHTEISYSRRSLTLGEDARGLDALLVRAADRATYPLTAERRAQSLGARIYVHRGNFVFMTTEPGQQRPNRQIWPIMEVNPQVRAASVIAAKTEPFASPE